MKKELKIGIFFLICFIIFAYFIIKTESLASLFSGSKTYNLYAKFSNIAGLFKTSPVRQAGVKIGLVDDIYLEEGKAVVKMLIQSKYKLTEDARAKTSSIGIVGENFVEIIYKVEFKTENPKILEDNGEIKTLVPFDLDSLGFKFDLISNKVMTLLDSANEVISDKNAKESLKTAIINMKLISENLKKISDDSGSLVKTFNRLDDISKKLENTLSSFDNFFEDIKMSFNGDREGILVNLKSAADKIKTIADDFKSISNQLKEGKGTAGKLIKDDSLYKKVDESIDSIKKILGDVEKKKESLDRAKLKYYAGIDYFTEQKRGRFSFGLNLNFNRFVLFSRVIENPLDGTPNFTLLLGKNFEFISIGAGMLDSGLGAALYFNLFNKRFNLGIEASRFYSEKYPFLKTVVSFSVTKNLSFSVGYEDIFEKYKRRFLLGISFSN